jgi:hypothetical protein
MFIDKLLKFASAQGAITTAGNYYGLVPVDTGAITGITGLLKQSEEMINIDIDTAFAGGTSIEFQVIGSTAAWTDAAGTGASGVVVYGTTGAIVDASLTLNKKIQLCLPKRIPLRYFGIRAVGVGTHSAGAFSAYIPCDTTQAIPTVTAG